MWPMHRGVAMLQKNRRAVVIIRQDKLFVILLF
jgi:hypothetical protein